MAICEITGKGKMYGHNVSFSQRKTRKVFKPNIQKRTLIVDGKKVFNISTKTTLSHFYDKLIKLYDFSTSPYSNLLTSNSIRRNL